MSSFELNKIFAALLVAALTAMLAGFIAQKILHPRTLEENAVSIEGSVTAGSSVQKSAGPEPVLHLIASADIAKGQGLSRACIACHSFEKGGAHKTGPNLWDIVGAPKGGKGGYGYSAAIKETGGAWGYEDLNKFLWKPKTFIPGTKMSYVGLKKPEDRAAIIAWLRTLADIAEAPPSAAEVAKEAAELAPPADEGAAAAAR